MVARVLCKPKSESHDLFLCHPMPWSFSLSSPFLSQLMINPVINSEPSEGNPREANGGWKDYHILILFSSPRFSRCNSSDKGSGHVAPSSLHRHWSGVIYALQRHRVRRSERAEGMRWGTSRETDPPNQDLTFLSPVGCGRDRNEWRERSVPSYIPFSFRSGMRREPWAKSVAWGWRTGTKNEESFCDRQGTPEDREGGLIPTKKDKGNEWKTLWWDHLPFMIHSWGSSFLSVVRPTHPVACGSLTVGGGREGDPEPRKRPQTTIPISCSLRVCRSLMLHFLHH